MARHHPQQNTNRRLGGGYRIWRSRKGLAGNAGGSEKQAASYGTVGKAVSRGNAVGHRKATERFAGQEYQFR